jgi:hypothetical protein
MGRERNLPASRVLERTAKVIQVFNQASLYGLPFGRPFFNIILE